MSTAAGQSPEEPVISDVTVHWKEQKTPAAWPEVILSIKGETILALTDPLDPESFTLIPLDSGLVRYVSAERSEGIDE
jgi:hypothetical protein